MGGLLARTHARTPTRARTRIRAHVHTRTQTHKPQVVDGQYLEVYSRCEPGVIMAKQPPAPPAYSIGALIRPYWRVPPTKQTSSCVDASGRVPGGCGSAAAPDEPAAGSSLRACLISCLGHSSLCRLGVQYRPGRCLFITHALCDGPEAVSFPRCEARPADPLCTGDNAGGWRIVTIRPTNGDKLICPPPLSDELRRERFSPCDLEEAVPAATECHGWTCDIETQRCAAGTPGATVDGNRCCFGMWLLGEGARASPATNGSEHALMTRTRRTPAMSFRVGRCFGLSLFPFFSC